jgi:hypothetical protein
MGKEFKMLRVLILISGVFLLFAAVATASETARLSIVDAHFEEGIQAPMEVTEDMISYDGAPTVYFPDYSQVGTIFAVRFTPLQPCSLTYVTIVSYEAPGNAAIHIYDDNMGEPGDDLIPSFNAYLLGNITRQRIDLPEIIDIGENDFHVGVEYTQTAPPHVTFDDDGGTGRSVRRLPGQNWQVFPLNDLNFRAFVRYYGEDEVPPTILSQERILGFSGEGDHPITATITDDSGILSASVYYSTDGVDYSSIAMDNTSGDIWVGNIPAQPIGTTVYYYIQAIDNSPNQNEALLPPTGPSAPWEMLIVEGLELAYDDGSVESWYIVGDEWDDNKFAVRFTPVEYPIQVTGARAMVNDATPFDFTINANSNGQPGSVLAGPFESFQNTDSWAVSFFPEEQRPEVTSGSFWLVFNWREGTPDSPGVGTDTDDPDSRSSWYNNSSGWNSFTSGDFIMRVIITTPTGISDLSPDGSLPEKFELIGNYPNPFNPATEIIFAAPRSGHVRLEIYDIIGRKVKTLLDENITAGLKAITWDGSSDSGYPVASGIYYYRLSTPDGIDIEKMTFLK